MRPASSSATAAIWVSRNLPIGPGGTLGRSQKTKSTSLATRERSRSTLRVRRSSARSGGSRPATTIDHISAVERAGLHGLAEGQKVSFEEKSDPRRGKSNAENLKTL